MTKTASGLYEEHAIQDTFACVKINPGNYVQVPITKMLRPVMQHNAPTTVTLGAAICIT